MTERTERDTAAYLFRGEELLVLETDGNGGEKFRLPTLEEAREIPESTLEILPRREGGSEPCILGFLAEGTPLPAGTRILPLRSIPGTFGEGVFLRAGRAHSLLRWLEASRYCGRCGTPMGIHPTDRAHLCPSCGLTLYPPVIPAIMAAVEREGKLLLARSPHFPKGRYSILAGFVEPGEDLEGAVRREVKEEVGLEVADLRYAASQPWPFPHSLMIGFFARWAGGEILADGVEIEDAFWRSPKEFPELPPFFSLARKLIDLWSSGALRR
jgi:NAD+ diphosphatase